MNKEIHFAGKFFMRKIVAVLIFFSLKRKYDVMDRFYA